MSDWWIMAASPNYRLYQSGIGLYQSKSDQNPRAKPLWMDHRPSIVFSRHKGYLRRFETNSR